MDKKKGSVYTIDLTDSSSDEKLKVIKRKSAKKSGGKDEDDSKMSSLLSPLAAQMAFAQGHVFNDMCGAMWFNYLLVYLQYVAEFRADIAGGALLIGQLVDGLVCPFIGVFSDKMRTGLFNYGRRKTAHIIGTIIVFLTFPFVFMPVPSILKNQDQLLQLGYYSIFITFFQIGWAMVQIAHLAIITDLTSDFRERTWLMSLRNIFTVISISSVFVIAYLVRKFCPYVQVGRSILRITSVEPADEYAMSSMGGTLGPNCAMQFVVIVAVISAVGMFETLWYHIGVKEVSDDGELSQNLIHSTESSASPWLLFYQLKFYSVTLVYVAARLFFNLLQVFVPIYLIETLHLPVSYIFIIPFVINLSNFATSLATTKLNVFFGRKLTFYIGCLLGIASGVFFFSHSILNQKFGSFYRYNLIFVISIVIGIATGILTVTALSLITDMIGQDANNGAFVYGFMSLVEKIFNGASVQIIQSFKPDDSSTHETYGKDALFVCCLVSCIIGLVFMYITPSNFGLRGQLHDSDQRSVTDSERPSESSDPTNRSHHP